MIILMLGLFCCSDMCYSAHRLCNGLFTARHDDQTPLTSVAHADHLHYVAPEFSGKIHAYEHEAALTLTRTFLLLSSCWALLIP